MGHVFAEFLENYVSAAMCKDLKEWPRYASLNVEDRLKPAEINSAARYQQNAIKELYTFTSLLSASHLDVNGCSFVC